jgi:hypothetical protein
MNLTFIRQLQDARQDCDRQPPGRLPSSQPRRNSAGAPSEPQELNAALASPQTSVPREPRPSGPRIALRWLPFPQRASWPSAPIQTSGRPGTLRCRTACARRTRAPCGAGGRGGEAGKCPRCPPGRLKFGGGRPKSGARFEATAVGNQAGSPAAATAPCPPGKGSSRRTVGVCQRDPQSSKLPSGRVIRRPSEANSRPGFGVVSRS